MIENCDSLSFAQVEQKIVDLAVKARDNKISMDEMRSGGLPLAMGESWSTFLHRLSILHKARFLVCTALLSPYVDGKVVIRPIMILALLMIIALSMDKKPFHLARS